MIIADIHPSLVDVSAEHKKVSPDASFAIAEDFKVRGQRQPIEVIEQKDGRYQLVFGAKRLAAAALLKITVKAAVRQPEEFADQAEIRLTGIAENFYRHSLSVLERSVDVADWCTIWRAAHPVKRGPKAQTQQGTEFSTNLVLNSTDAEIMEQSETFALSFSEAAQRFLKIGRNEVFRSIKIAGISADLRDRMAIFVPLCDNQQALLAIANEPYERASAIIELVLDGKAQNITEAIIQLDGAPMPNEPARWEKIADRFARLKPSEQDHFFALHEAAVLRWFAERQAAR